MANLGFPMDCNTFLDILELPNKQLNLDPRTLFITEILQKIVTLTRCLFATWNEPPSFIFLVPSSWSSFLGLIFLVLSPFRCQISDSRFQIPDFWFLISYFWFQISDVRYQLSDFKFQISYSRPQISYFRFQLSGFIFQVFRFQVLDFRFSISGFRIQFPVFSF